MEDMLSWPVERCGFSIRLTNVLRNSNYRTIGDILNAPMQKFWAEMKYTPNFGKKSALEFKQWLYSLKAFNCSNFKQELEQLKELHELQAKVNNLIIEKQKQLDLLLLNIELA